MAGPLQGCYVETPFGWGICCNEEPLHLKVALDWRVSNGGPRVLCWVRHSDISRRSFCAVGSCVLTSFGAGVLLAFRKEDDMHEVQLWGPLSKGRHSAFLCRDALLRVLPAAPGLPVDTPYGPGICKGVAAQSDSSLKKCSEPSDQEDCYFVVWPWGRGELHGSCITCPAAVTLPLISSFVDRAQDLFRLYSGTLTRLAEALGGVGLEKLRDQLVSRAGEAAQTALRLWEELEEKETKEVMDTLKSQADEMFASPKVKGLLDAGVARLNKMICRAQGFDGTWVGKDDGGQPRCVVEDATITWHWGEESELEIWGADSISTLLAGEVFQAQLLPDGSLRWTDGDIWVLTGGGPVVPATEDEEERHLGLEDAMGELQESLPVDLARLRRSLEELRQVVNQSEEGSVTSPGTDLSQLQEDGSLSLDAGLARAIGALTHAARVAKSDTDVQCLTSALEEELQQRHGQLLEMQEQLLKSKTAKVILEGQDRLTRRLEQLQETAITPQLDAMQKRGKRLVTRLATDKKVKNKATELFTAVQSRINGHLGDGGVEGWVSSVRERVMAQLGESRALLVDGLSGLQLQLKEGDLRQLVSSASWDRAADLEAQLEESLVKALSLSGIDGCTGSDLLDRFENASSLSNLPVLQTTSSTLLGLLSDFGLEVPNAVRHLLEAQAAGRAQDVEAWQAALVGSLDDDVVVNGASELVERGETLITHLQDLKSSQTVAKVMEHLENEDIERDLLSSIHKFNPEQVLSHAENALTNAEAREALISQLKDTCLDFILKILPAIHIEKVSGHDNGCDWEISDINFSDFHFRKEDVRVSMSDPLRPFDELLRVSAWDIEAHFKKLNVSVNQTSFPYMQAECVADAAAERMSVALAFRLQASSDGPPVLAMSSRSVHMENLELWVHESNSGVSMIVNALSFLFADVLKSYACQKIASRLDEHMGTLVTGLNTCLQTCMPLLERLGLKELLEVQKEQEPGPPSAALRRLSDAGNLLGLDLAEEPRARRRSLAELAALDPEPIASRGISATPFPQGDPKSLLIPAELIYADPGRSFAVRL